MSSLEPLRLGRSSKAKEDREYDDRRSREKLRLPILEGFEPELRAYQVMAERLWRLTVQYRFRIGRQSTAVEMQDEA